MSPTHCKEMGIVTAGVAFFISLQQVQGYVSNFICNFMPPRNGRKKRP
jgi:hypothetical protein